MTNFWIHHVCLRQCKKDLRKAKTVVPKAKPSASPKPKATAKAKAKAKSGAKNKDTQNGKSKGKGKSRTQGKRAKASAQEESDNPCEGDCETPAAEALDSEPRRKRRQKKSDA